MIEIIKYICSSFLFIAIILAQWSTNTSSPQLIGSGIQPQIALTSDGGTFIAWLTDSDYYIYVQRMDPLGVAQFDDGGLLVSDNDNASWIAVSHLNIVVDADDNAIISTVDQRTGNWEVYVWKISSDGLMLWGGDGIAITNSSTSNISPRLKILDDNSLIVACGHNDGEILFQRVSSNGELLWGDGIIKQDENRYLVSPQSIIDEDGNIIFQWLRQSPGWPIYSEIFIQKYDLNGLPSWVEPILIVGPTLFPMGNWSQQILAASNGGSFISWTEFSGNVQTAMVESISQEGTALWNGGIEISENSNNFRMSPMLAISDVSYDAMAVWREANGSQSQHGIFAQRIDSTGNKLWGEYGVAVVDMNSSYDYLDVSVSAFDDAIIIAYLEQSPNMNGDIYSKKLDSLGNMIWEDQTVTITSSNTQKSDMDVEKGSNYLIISWSENGSIFAHSLKDNGSLGPPDIIPTVDCDSGFVEIDGLCFHENDLAVLQDMIDNSYESGIVLDCDEWDNHCGSPNPYMDDPDSWFLNTIDGEEYNFSDGDGIVQPLELGIQEWEDGRLTSIMCGAYIYCQLSGPIPSSISEWTELDQFRFEFNYFSSFLPEAICELNLNYDDDLSFDLTGNQLCPPYPDCLSETEIGEQDTSNCNQLFEWNFSIGDPLIGVLGGYDQWNPGKIISLEMDFCNNSDIGHMFYPGVVLESDSNLTSIFNNYYWFYGMDSDTCNKVYFTVLADSSIISDTVIIFSAYPKALNCENQPQYCIQGDTIIFEFPVVSNFTNAELNFTVPQEFVLHQNYPNPFNPATMINYDLPNDGFVKITVYDMLGNVISNLINNNQTTGFKSVQWNAIKNQGQPVSAGVYLYSIEAGDFRQTKKMIFLK